MNVWEIAILRSIDYRGGRARNYEIFAELESGRFISLSDNHLRVTDYGGRPAYKHQVRKHLSNLERARDLNRVARGTYQITPQGRSRIAG